MLGGLGVSKSKTSTIEVTAETEKEVMTLDDQETFGNFFKSVSQSPVQDRVVVTEEDLSQIQADTPKLVYINSKLIIHFIFHILMNSELFYRLIKYFNPKLNNVTMLIKCENITFLGSPQL